MTFLLSDFKKTSRPRRTGREGKALESLILASTVGITLTRVEQAGKMRRGFAGRPVMQPTKSCLDFFGCLPGGRMIVFDAKTCANANHLTTSGSTFPEHQRAELLRYGRAGAVAGLLALRSTDDELYWCPWELLRVRRPSIEWVGLPWLGLANQAIDWRRVMAECEPSSILEGDV